MKKSALIIILALFVCLIGVSAILFQNRQYRTNVSIREDLDSRINMIWAADFQDQKTGTFDYKDIKKEFGSNGYVFGRSLSGVGYILRKHPHMDNDLNVTIEEENGNKFTRNWFMKGQYGIVDSNRPEGSGHLYHPKIPGNHEELWISHNVRWPLDRDWAFSGKIGVGVVGGDCPGGCNTYEENKHNGFEITLMWSKDRELKLYMYWPGKNDSLSIHVASQGLLNGMTQISQGKNWC